MTAMHNEEHRRWAAAKVVTATQSILSGGLGIVAGSRELAGLRFDVGAEHDPDFIFFVGVDSETDHLPVGDVRSRWSADAVRGKDEELRAFEASVRDKAYRACQSLIQKYGTHDAEPDAPPNGGSATLTGGPEVTEGPPSVS